MKYTIKNFLPLLLVALITIGCQDLSKPNFHRGLATPNAQLTTGEDKIKVATFNIKVFGKTKASKPEVMKKLVEIVSAYDVVAIQEFKDSSGQTPKDFLSAINDAGFNYGMILSPRTGVQEDDQSSQEQYAYYYDKGTIKPIGQASLYDDSSMDYFQREPFLARFKATQGNFTFVCINIHTKPGRHSEISALHEVNLWAQGKYSSEDDFITLGDFNAGKGYVSPATLDTMNIRGGSYYWIVPDSADTNVAASVQAHDRIVVSANTQQEFLGTWSVDQVFTSGDISDHYPVHADFGVIEK